MIVEFKITNFRSICDSQVFSMVASKSEELPQNSASSDFNAEMSLLRSAVIYGPNAAGKSNLLKGLQLMQWLILTSAKESQAGEKIPVQAFLFDKQTSEQATEFEVTFSKDKVRYQYGFSLNQGHILEEWLYAYPAGRVQRWFVREYNKKENNYNWKFSKELKGSKQQIVDLTRPQVLFLSNAVKLNNEQLLPVFNWFRDDLIIINSLNSGDFEKSIGQIKNLQEKKEIIEYLNVADPSIIDIDLEVEKFTEDKLPQNMPEEIKRVYAKNLVNHEMFKIDFLHSGNTNLNIREESEGTIKFFSYSGQWRDMLKYGKTVLVDELNNSLHPLAVKFLINKLHDPEANKNNAQLIFSTHDTSLLDTELFRRDQVWFVEKDKKNSTQLYPLLDFSPRKNEAIGRGYLQGRYGALPFVGDWRY